MNNTYKSLWELEKATDTLGRMNYLKRLKEMYEIREEDIKMLKQFPRDTEEYKYTLENEQRFLNKLKIKIETYDLYEQKTPYKCSVCKEKVQDCLCDLKDIPQF